MRYGCAHIGNFECHAVERTPDGLFVKVDSPSKVIICRVDDLAGITCRPRTAGLSFGEATKIGPRGQIRVARAGLGKYPAPQEPIGSGWITPSVF